MNKLVQSRDTMAELIETINTSEFLAVDLETTGLFPLTDKVAGIAVCGNGKDAFYVPLKHLGKCISHDTAALLLKLLSLKKTVYHKAQFDIEFIYTNFGLWMEPWDCTMLCAYLNCEQSLGLKQLTEKYFSMHQIEFETLMKQHFGHRWKTSGRNISDLNPEAVLDYACSDVIGTFRLKQEIFTNATMSEYASIHKVEVNLIPIVAKMNITGCPVTSQGLKAAADSIREGLGHQEELIYRLAKHKFNINSPRELATVLFGELSLEEQSRSSKTGMPSVDKNTLEALLDAHPIVKEVKEWRENTRMLKAYLDKIPFTVDSHGRIYTEFNSIGAASGRFTSQSRTDEKQVAHGLNFQNIPKRNTEVVRKAFIAPEGFTFAHADYSQIEYRVMASLAKDQVLLKGFRDGIDFHAQTASLAFNKPLSEITDQERQRGKVFNFGLSYGMTAKGLSMRSEMSEEAAELFIRKYFERASGLARFIEHCKDRAPVDKCTRTFFGRKRLLDFDRVPPSAHEKLRKKGFNTKVQGTAADIIKIAMLRVADAIAPYGNDVQLILQLHDELNFLIRTSLLDEVLPKIQAAMEIPVSPEWAPIVVEMSTGPTWASSDQTDWNKTFPKDPFTGWGNIVPSHYLPRYSKTDTNNLVELPKKSG